MNAMIPHATKPRPRTESIPHPIPRSLQARRGIRCAPSLLALLVVAACVGEAPDTNGYVVRDSAGSRIVENTDWAWASGLPWRVEDEPVVTIGTVGGAPEYQLYRVRGALRLADGTIVVGDGGSNELRFYDVTGRHNRSVGGDGDGPGEYRVISRFFRYGADSLVVWDARLERFTVLALDGSLGSTFARPDFGGGYPSIEGIFADRSMLVQFDEGVRLEEEPAGVRANRSTVMRRSPAGTIDTIAHLLTSEAFISARHGTLISMPFGRSAVLAAADTLFHYGLSDTYELRTYAADGTLFQISRVARGPLVVTQPMIDAFIAGADDIEDPDRRRRMREIYEEVPYPTTLPTFDELIADRAGNLWAAEYRTDDDDPRFWMVFDASGRWLGRVETPPGLIVHEIGGDYVLGVERDEIGVERVVTYAIAKPG